MDRKQPEEHRQNMHSKVYRERKRAAVARLRTYMQTIGAALGYTGGIEFATAKHPNKRQLQEIKELADLADLAKFAAEQLVGAKSIPETAPQGAFSEEPPSTLPQEETQPTEPPTLIPEDSEEPPSTPAIPPISGGKNKRK